VCLVFSDQGSQFDGSGQLRDWWSPTVRQRFTARSECLVHQYSAFPVGDLLVNGNLTLGENIADNGGLRLAWMAWHKYNAAHGPETAISPAITPERLFFLSFAQSWCQLITPQYARLLVTSDPHSPAKARVNLPLQNFDAFATTFGCPAGSPMNPQNKCVLW
jgi:predicted metalloendopeptidase